MENELAQLEQRIEQLVVLYEGGRAENRELRERVARLEADNRRLTEKVERAIAGVESALAKLPEA